METTLSRCVSVAVRALLVVALFAVPAVCPAGSLTDLMVPGFYELNDHPDGMLAEPFYGLRLDGLGGDPSREFTFSFDEGGADMFLELKAVDSEIYSVRIFGWAYGGEVENNAYVDPILWAIDFTYDAVVEMGDRLVSNTFDQATGTIMAKEDGRDFTMGQSFDLREFVDSPDKKTFFIGTGHRGVDGLSGWGWLNHSGTSIDEHVYDSDWLFVVGDMTDPKMVPEPAVVTLLVLGLGGLLARRR